MTKRCCNIGGVKKCYKRKNDFSEVIVKILKEKRDEAIIKWGDGINDAAIQVLNFPDGSHDLWQRFILELI